MLHNITTLPLEMGLLFKVGRGENEQLKFTMLTWRNVLQKFQLRMRLFPATTTFHNTELFNYAILLSRSEYLLKYRCLIPPTATRPCPFPVAAE